MSKYSHRSGCTCNSCEQIRRVRRSTGNRNWDHRDGCGCGNCRQVENLRGQEELSRQIRNSKRHGSQSRSTGGCFLTTAACEYMGLPDDCHELETLRNFRDEYLATTDSGKLLISEYYVIAPEIARRLNDPADLHFVWGGVQQAILAIETGDPEQAVRTYMEMVVETRARVGA